MTDPISNMFCQIKNAQSLSQPEVKVPFSKIKYGIAKILEKEDFISKVEKLGKGAKKQIRLVLKYEGGKPSISEIKRVSKSSKRVYSPSKKLRQVKGGFGLAIISTPKGLLTDSEARKNKAGGEIICEVW